MKSSCSFPGLALKMLFVLSRALFPGGASVVPLVAGMLRMILLSI